MAKARDRRFSNTGWRLLRVSPLTGPCGPGISPSSTRLRHVWRYCHIKCDLATLDGWNPENPYITAIGFLRTSSATQYGCTILSASVIGMLRIYWPNVESRCRTKRSAAGAFDLARSMRIGYVNDRVQAAISGLSMKSLFGSTDSNIICFEPLIRMGRFWIFWSRNGGTRKPRPVSFVGFSSNNAKRLGGSSPINSEATLPRIAR